MSKSTLQFLGRVNNVSTFYDPLNVDSQLTHKVSSSRRTVGPDRLRQVRNDFSQIRHYKYKSCNTAECGVNDFVGGNVSLYGVSPEEIQLVWNDLKANVDAAIAAGVLNGIPLAMNVQALTATVAEAAGA